MLMPFICLLVGLALSRWLARFSGSLMYMSLLVLLWGMGVKIGDQPHIFYALPHLGLKALIFLVMIILVSLVFTVTLEHLVHWRKNISKQNQELKSKQTAEAKFVGSILAALVIGIVLGRLTVIPADSYEKIINYALMAIFVSVGMGIWEGIKSLMQNGRVWLYLLLPGAFLLTSLIGAALAGFLTGIPWQQALAIGGGMGYYSVAGPLVTQYAGADVGFIAFLTNFMREILTFFITPLLMRVSYLLPLALGGATVMDTTLAVVQRYLGEEMALAGFISGVVLTLAVPWLELLILM
ncbi:MAG: lysine exporter LysO family protein [Methylocystaceae bacterium]